jgi:hypothetical protein
VPADTAASTPVATDTLASQPSTTPAATAPTDTIPYKMIFEITPSKKRAVTRTSQLQTLRINAKYDSVSTGEAKRYRIYVTKRLTASDTLRVKDSIARFFLKKVIIDRQ